ncbi:hypothetical protein Taro_022176, partial [Colocasia esculenta]|nr:hypothetical protein [Colocasia esculenta]
MDGGFLLQAKRAGLLWLAGFWQACCLHRVVHFCRSSRKLLIRTGQCFLLNGLIFLGSLLFLYKVVIPTLLWILPEQCQELGFQDLCASGAVMRFYSFLHYTLVNLFYIFWFYPLYGDIAKMAFERSGLHLEEPAKKNEVPNLKSAVPVDKPAGFEGVIIGIGEQVYSALLLTIFYIEVFLDALFEMPLTLILFEEQVIAIGYIPFIGKAINFLLLSWIYAYYCFEYRNCTDFNFYDSRYKWNLSELSFHKRLNFFELNWAFFAGF